MQTNSRRSPQLDPNEVTKSGLLTLSGYGLRVAVERGHLVFSDGFGRQRRSGRLSKATSQLKRLVILGHSGSVTLDAMRWLHDIGAAFVHIDADGEVIVVSAPIGRDDAHLRRAQALASSNGVGLEIARGLIAKKLEGQRRVLSQLPVRGDIDTAIATALAALPAAQTGVELRYLEAAAASAHWGVLAGVEVRFARADASRVPDHWLIVGTRSSPLTGSPRRAANPANALLNYLYALLEAECRIAALTLGLDPGLGVLHADQRNRDSMALDLMEAVRPDVDSYVLDLLQQRTFAKREFFERRDGGCRLVAPLPQMLAEQCDVLRTLVAPVAEQVAQQLVTLTRRSAGVSAVRGGAVETQRLATPLTGANRSAGRPVNRRSDRAVQVRAASLGDVCQQCGAVLVSTRREYCDACFRSFRADKLPKFIESGPAALARMRREDRDPTKTPEARERMRQRRQEQHRLDAQRDSEHPARPDPETFRREILSRLSEIPLSVMEAVTGLSKRQCSRIRRGENVPHPRHWAELEGLAS